jgi:hypothetical protein
LHSKKLKYHSQNIQIPNHMSQPLTRQELYDRVRVEGKDPFVLAEMKRLGFWEENKAEPSLAEVVLLKEGELQTQLNKLYQEKHRLQDKEALLKDIRKQRMEESRRKRQETKLRKVQERKIAAENWAKRKEKEILYLGEGVSFALNRHESDVEKLKSANLPILTDAESVAAELKIPISEIRFLAFARDVSKVNHYKRFTIPKKTGGERTISAPMPRLKYAQSEILIRILQKVNIHEAAHGFVSEKSIVSNAMPHLQSEVVINMDLKDFFPTITYDRVKGVFRNLGYSQHVATILALICSEQGVDKVELDGENWFIASGERRLPQGAPTSPMITNILCRHLDKRLAGLALKLGFRYTRYADDLTFSATHEGAKNVNLLLKTVREIVTSEGLVIHPDKTKVMRKGSRQEVTGITVNQKPTVCSKRLKQFRAFLHQIEKDKSVQGKKWGQSNDCLESALGFARYVKMVQPEKGTELLKKTKEIISMIQPNYKPQRRLFAPKKLPITPETVLVDTPKKRKWQFWK